MPRGYRTYPGFKLAAPTEAYPSPAQGEISLASWDEFYEEGDRLFAGSATLSAQYWMPAGKHVPVLVWTDPFNEEQIHPMCGLLLKGIKDPQLCQWIPSNWTIHTVPVGWTIPHLLDWLKWALEDAGRTVARLVNGDTDWPPPRVNSVRLLLFHTYLAVQQAGLTSHVPAQPVVADDLAALTAIQNVNAALLSLGAVVVPSQPSGEASSLPDTTSPSQCPEEKETQPPRRRRRMSKEEAEVAVREWLWNNARANPFAVTREMITKELGCSTGLVSSTSAWIAFAAQRDKLKPKRGREVQLSDEMLAVIPDDVVGGDDETWIDEHCDKMVRGVRQNRHPYHDD